MKRIVLLVLALAASAAGTTRLSAQACIGLPLPEGGLWLAGLVSGGDPAQYGVEFTSNFSGPLSLSLDYLRTDDDADGYTLGARAAYELPYMEPSLCPTVGVRYSRVPVTGADDATRVAIPVGVGVGKTLPLSPAAALTVFAIPEYSFFVKNEGFEDSNGELGAELGALLGLGPLYVGASARVGDAFGGDADLLFRLAIGL